MFNKANLQNIVSVQGFGVWLYDAGTPQVANAARNQMDFFPADSGVKRGDVIYIRDQDHKTSHHWVDYNTIENARCLQLFG